MHRLRDFELDKKGKPCYSVDDVKEKNKFAKGDKVRIYDTVLHKYVNGVVEYTTEFLVLCRAKGRMYAESWVTILVDKTVKRR